MFFGKVRRAVLVVPDAAGGHFRRNPLGPFDFFPGHFFKGNCCASLM